MQGWTMSPKEGAPALQSVHPSCYDFAADLHCNLHTLCAGRV